MHRDIKLANTLMNELCNIKICDFGLSTMFEPGQTFRERCGSIPYMTLEQLLGKEYTEIVDFWAVGVVLYVLMTKEFPFKPPKKEIK